jgi:hypothetical protein
MTTIDFCTACDAPQYVFPDGLHHCAEVEAWAILLAGTTRAHWDTLPPDVQEGWLVLGRVVEREHDRIVRTAIEILRS